MKCYTTNGVDLDGLIQVEKPESHSPCPGEVLVNVHSVSLNYRDILVAKGLYGGKQDPPIIACSDMSGVVESVGEGVGSFKKGDRVLNAPFRFFPAGTLQSDWIRTFVGGAGVDGVLAEQIVYPAHSLVKLPNHFNFHEGSTLTIAGLTAWAAVISKGRAKAGDWILAHGTGGVSIFAAQIAKMIGARIVLTTSSEEKAHIVKDRFGVDATLNYKDENWLEQLSDITNGEGVDVVVEVVGGDMLPKSIQACGFGGRVCLIGVLGGLDSNLNTVEIFRRQVSIHGIYMESTEQLRALTRACETNEIKPCIDRVFPFNQAREAYNHLISQKHIGKVIIDLKA